MSETKNTITIGNTTTVTTVPEGSTQYVEVIHPLRKPVDRAIQLIFNWRNSDDPVLQKCADELERALHSYEGDTDPELQIYLYPKDYPMTSK